MRDFIDRKVSLSALVLAGVVLAGGVMSLAQDIVLCQVGQPCHCGFTNPCFEPKGPVLLEPLGCADARDRGLMALYRADCDDLAEDRGFQTGVVQQQAGMLGNLNVTHDVCGAGERYLVCAGVGGGACTSGPTNCTFVD